MADLATQTARVGADGSRTVLPRIAPEPRSVKLKPGRKVTGYLITHEIIGRPGDATGQHSFRQLDDLGKPNPPYPAEDFKVFGPEGLQRLLDLGAIEPVYAEEN